MEKILCSAIHIKNPNVIEVYIPVNINYGLVICGKGHHNCFETMSHMEKDIYWKTINKEKYEINQGFLTTSNRFVDRETARFIAIDAGQIDLDYDRKELFSEFINY